MNNTLAALNNALFEEIERMQNDDLSPEELQQEIERAQAVSKVGEIIVKNAELAYKTMVHLNEYGYSRKKSENTYLAPIPEMLEVKQ